MFYAIGSLEFTCYDSLHRIFWNEKAKYFHYPWYLAVYKNLDLAKDLFIVVKLMLYLGGLSVILANYTIFSSNVSEFNVEQ